MIQIQEVTDIVCSALKVDSTKLTQRNFPCQDCIDARHLIIHFAKKHTNLTYAEIALYFGRKLASGKGDHAAAIYSDNLVDQLVKVDKPFREKYYLSKECFENHSSIKID